MNPATGLVCRLTNEKPAFEENCPDLKIDPVEADRLVQLEKSVLEEEEASGFFAPERIGIRKGVIGGVIMVAIAIVWFVIGLINGYIYFYPPILFVIGVFALIKGLKKKNIKAEINKNQYS